MRIKARGKAPPTAAHRAFAWPIRATTTGYTSGDISCLNMTTQTQNVHTARTLCPKLPRDLGGFFLVLLEFCGYPPSSTSSTALLAHVVLLFGLLCLGIY